MQKKGKAIFSIFPEHERFLSILFHPKDFFFTLFHYEDLQNVNPNASHTGIFGSGRNVLCSAKRKINVVTIEIKKHFYFCNVYFFLCLISRHALNFYQWSCFKSSHHSLKTPDLWIFDNVATFWQMGNFLIHVFCSWH